MGNLEATECRSICGLAFISSSELRSTSLKPHPPPPQRSVKPKSHTTLVTYDDYVGKDKPLTPDPLKMKKDKTSNDLLDRPFTFRRSNTYHLSLKETSSKISSGAICENDFAIVKTLPDGRYGRVCLVKKKDREDIYRMKNICKRKVLSQTSIDNLKVEKQILERANHYSLPKIVFYFENENCVSLVTQHVEGSDLQTVLQQLHRFSEEITKFYSAEILLALEYMHEQLGIVYGDLNLENVIIDDKGHICFADMSMAHSMYPASKSDLDTAECTPSRELHEAFQDKMNDYWQFGCLIYELMCGKKPFQETSLSPSKKKNLDLPPYLTRSAKDLISRLLNPKVEDRLGYNGVQEIKDHEFFSSAGFTWEKIAQQTMYPPLNPVELKKKFEINEEDAELQEDDCSLILLSENGSGSDNLSNMKLSSTMNRRGARALKTTRESLGDAYRSASLEDV